MIWSPIELSLVPIGQFPGQIEGRTLRFLWEGAVARRPAGRWQILQQKLRRPLGVFFDMWATGARRSTASQRGAMANLRYAQSGHRKRAAERDARSVPAPARARVVVLVAAVLFPAAVGVAVPRLRQAPAAPSSAASASAPTMAGAIGPSSALASLAAPAPELRPLALPASPPTPPLRPPPGADAPAAALVAMRDGAAMELAAAEPALALVRVVDRLRPDEALSSALARHGTSADDVSSLVRALKPHLQVRSLRAGLTFMLEKTPTAAGQALASFELRTTSPDGVPRRLRAERQERPITLAGARTGDAADALYVVSVKDAPIETAVEGVAGAVRTSLYQALLDAGEDANLVNKFVDVFAWNVDFYRQTHRGDEFRVLVEKRYAGEGAERRFLGYGKVLAAEYVNAGAVHRGFLFESRDGKHAGTYDDEGNALQRTFLKSPMAIAQVTSSYGMRFHPVLRHNKKHEGIDYGAPTGTPVWTVADGVVREAHYSKTAGNMVRIEHINGIWTEYFHLSKYAEGIKPGARVKQKQAIGAVGSTGMSTGPHLHFGMLRGGAHVDPQKQKFPNARPVPREYKAEYEDFVKPLLTDLKALNRV
jgi:murein DD-endopeptidase MepM/ murein hydrolase activator NlpD